MTTSGMPFRQVDTISRLKVGDIISFQFNQVPSLKLTWNLPLKMDGWNKKFPWDGPISGATRMLVSGSVITLNQKEQHMNDPLLNSHR